MSGFSAAALSNALFNANYYLQNNPDVLAAIAKGQFTSALDHFIKFGQYENRSPNLVFNGAQYLVDNLDTAAAVGSKQLTSAWAHFTTYGIAELRASGTFTGPFNETAYLAANADVAAAVKAGSFLNGYHHFLLFGQYENRNGVPMLTTGQTLALTTGLDTPTSLVAGPGNDTFIATYGTNGTLNPGDSVDGQGGINTLQIIATDSTATPNVLAGVTVANIQTISLQQLSLSRIQTMDLTLYATVSKVISLSSRFIVFKGLATGAQVISSSISAPIFNLVHYAYLNPTDAVFLSANGGVGGTGFINRGGTPTAATINSTGTVNGKIGFEDNFGLTDLTSGASIKTLTVNATTNLVALLNGGDYVATGAALTVYGLAASVSLSGPTTPGVSANFKTIDASGLTAGGLTIGLGSNTASFKGGASGNVVSTGLSTTALGIATVLGTTVASSINAGTGTGNVLVVNASADVATATLAQVYAGFNTISAGNGVTVDLSLFSNSTITAEKVSGDAILNQLSAAQAAAITVTGSATSGATFNVIGATTPGQNDILGLTVNDGAVVGSTVFLGAIQAAGVETININVANALDVVTISSFAGDTALTNLILSGLGSASVTGVTNSFPPNSKIDASGLAGTLSLNSGSTSASVPLLIRGSVGGTSLFLGNNSGNIIDMSANVIGGSLITLGGSSDQTITLGAHTATDTVVFRVQTLNGSINNFVTVNNFNVGVTNNTSDKVSNLQRTLLATADTTTFATGGQPNVGANATVVSGVATFDGTTAATTLSNLIAAAENGLGAVANSAVAFAFNGNTYVVTTPAGVPNNAVNDHVAALIGVTGVTALGLSSVAPTGANIGHTLLIG